MTEQTEHLTPKAMRTRAALLEAARLLIGQKGVDGVTVMAVCEIAEVGRTSFYNYFDGVTALTETVAANAAQDIKTRFDDLHQGQARGLARLERCLIMILEIATQDRETALLITSLAQNTSFVSDLLRHEIAQELNGANNLNHQQRSSLSGFLTISTLALCREIATGRIPQDQIALLTSIMLGTCKTE